MSIERTTVAVDLGKSRCRVAVMRDSGRVVYEDAGSPGLATADGTAAAVAAMLPLLGQVGDIDLLGIGAAGAWAAGDAAAELARRLAQETGACVAVTSDVVTAHIGALEGGSGVLLIAGTGAAALGVDDEGIRLVDGWGPDLGDLGSGSWLGREGVRATLQAANGLGAATSLTDAVRAHISPTSDPVAWLADDIPTARQLATVAPLVLDAAAAGDPVAKAIAVEAARLLTASAAAASGDSPVVCLHGGLADHTWFRAMLERTLLDAGRTILPAAGDALDGALLVARRLDLPHERFVHRAE